MKCSTETLTRPAGTLSPRGEGRALPSPFREKVAEGRMRVLIAWIILCLAGSLSWACPLCKEALAQGMAKGFNWSILLMISVPFVVVGVIAGLLRRSVQRRQARPGSPHE